MWTKLTESSANGFPGSHSSQTRQPTDGHIPVFTLIPLHAPKYSLHFENILGCWDRMPRRLATPRVSPPSWLA